MGTIAVAAAHPNIALIKYWGNRDEALRLPQNGSISLTLGGLHTITRVRFSEDLASDRVVLQGQQAGAAAHERVSRHLDLVRQLAGLTARAEVSSASDFPVGVGLASSASAFAALSVAAAAAANLDLSQIELSRLARRGSGSACRSIFGGFVEWFAGQDDRTSHAAPLAPVGHWPLVDLVAVISTAQKAIGSTEGHRLAATSPLQAARVSGANARLDACRAAIRRRDFAALAAVVEEDSDLMHAVMESSTPSLRYRLPASHTVTAAVRAWRAEGAAVCSTLDAGPNVHCLCPAEDAARIEERLRGLEDVAQVIPAAAGGPARLLEPDDPLIGLL
jgi:diphosphomevalonate decarboxylase